MKKKSNLFVSIAIMTIGIVVLSWILIRFYNQGYFGGEPRVLYTFPYEMKDWFGSIIYSALFSIAGYLLLKKESSTLKLFQFIVVGGLLDRIWYILERVNNLDVYYSLVPMLLIFLAVLYLIHHEDSTKVLLKRGSIYMLLNLILISIGKFILPNI